MPRRKSALTQPSRSNRVRSRRRQLGAFDRDDQVVQEANALLEEINQWQSSEASSISSYVQELQSLAQTLANLKQNQAINNEFGPRISNIRQKLGAEITRAQDYVQRVSQYSGY